MVSPKGEQDFYRRLIFSFVSCARNNKFHFTLGVFFFPENFQVFLLKMSGLKFDVRSYDFASQHINHDDFGDNFLTPIVNK